jgi:hypothetical protein
MRRREGCSQLADVKVEVRRLHRGGDPKVGEALNILRAKELGVLYPVVSIAF